MSNEKHSPIDNIGETGLPDNEIKKVNYVEKILHGMAPMHPPRGTYNDVIYGLKSAMIFANNLPHGAALTGQLVDIANLIWDYENNRLSSPPDPASNEHYREALEKIKTVLDSKSFGERSFDWYKEQLNTIVTLALEVKASKEQENDAIEFAKVYHNHVMETMQPPFKQRLSIEQLYKEYKNKP